MMIRRAREEDRFAVEEISRLTWDGDDYLADAFSKWLEDGNFYVLEEGGKVIGTVKLTLLPGGVGWMEGLRVHPAYRGRGYGRILHEFILDIASGINPEINCLEFATHLQNIKSRKMAEHDGFTVVEKFYFSYIERGSDAKFEKSHILRVEEMDYEHRVPYGWKFIKIGEDAVQWINANAGVGKMGDFKFLYPLSDTEPAFTPFIISEESIENILPGMSWHARRMGKRYISLMVPESREEIIPYLVKRGFMSVVDFSEPDVLIYHLSL